MTEKVWNERIGIRRFRKTQVETERMRDRETEKDREVSEERGGSESEIEE